MALSKRMAGLVVCSRFWATTSRSFSSSLLRLRDGKEGMKKEELFFDGKVESLLKSLTGLDNSQVFRVAKLGRKIAAPTYAFLTEEQLKKLQANTQKKAERKLQMPPVMDERSSEVQVLDVDEAIQGYDAAQLVCTDITYGVHDRDRIIVVRDPDGTLRHADPEQRDRLNQIYFPRDGRKVYTPPMFHPESLQEILGKERYLYILDRNCAQFEPDHPVYIRTAAAVYDHVNANNNYHSLWSTRHYGPMVFHLVWEKKCDDLLAYYLSKPNMEAVGEVLLLFAKFWPSSKFCEHMPPEEFNREATIESLRHYINLESHKSAKLKGALESMLEVEESNKNAAEGLSKAHNT